jgi:uncharacterized DUF497 family protein
MDPTFEWDEQKNGENQRKHGVTFEEAQMAFLDPRRVILRDAEHSEAEERYFLLGRTAHGILTVRFTWRNGRIRIIGAGYWRKGKRRYEQENFSS